LVQNICTVKHFFHVHSFSVVTKWEKKSTAGNTKYVLYQSRCTPNSDTVTNHCVYKDSIWDFRTVLVHYEYLPFYFSYAWLYPFVYILDRLNNSWAKGNDNRGWFRGIQWVMLCMNMYCLHRWLYEHIWNNYVRSLVKIYDCRSLQSRCWSLL
jgi:hypothetical protein